MCGYGKQLGDSGTTYVGRLTTNVGEVPWDNAANWISRFPGRERPVVYDTMDIDQWEVIEAAKTKPFGFMPFLSVVLVGGVTASRSIQPNVDDDRESPGYVLMNLLTERGA